MQSAVQFEHHRAILPGDFVNFHRNLDHGAIERAESVKKLVDVPASNAVRTQISLCLLIWLVHQMAPSELIDLLIAQLELEGKRKQLIAAIRDLVPTRVA